MAAVTGHGKSHGQGRTSIGAEVHLCIFSSPLPKSHQGNPQKSRWYMGTQNHLEGLRELGGGSQEPTLEDERAASLPGEMLSSYVLCIFRIQKAKSIPLGKDPSG